MLRYAQNPLHAFPLNFPVYAGSRCNGIWETTRHNRQRTSARVNLLRTCYGETGVMDLVAFTGNNKTGKLRNCFNDAYVALSLGKIKFFFFFFFFC